MEIHKFAAIDIGSNAIRLLFTNVMQYEEKTFFKKSALLRVPLRLGEDSFTIGKITDEKVEKLKETMKAFCLLMNVHDVVSYRACATSAMREASNSEEVVKSVLEETGVEINVIEGSEEAAIIFSNGLTQTMDPNKPYLYVDVGGGSTELTVFYNGEVVSSRSFKIGTIRLLNNQVTKNDWKELRVWVKANTLEFDNLFVIGSGGNINKMYKLLRKAEGLPVPYRKLREFHSLISKLTVDELMMDYGMNPDRADVITHASNVFVNIMKWAKVKYLYAPRIGVSDGIVRQLYKEYSQRELKPGEVEFEAR